MRARIIDKKEEVALMKRLVLSAQKKLKTSKSTTVFRTAYGKCAKITRHLYCLLKLLGAGKYVPTKCLSSTA